MMLRTETQAAPGQAEAQEEKVSGEQSSGLEEGEEELGKRVEERGEEVENVWRQVKSAEQFDQGCSVTRYSWSPVEARCKATRTNQETTSS